MPPESPDDADTRVSDAERQVVVDRLTSAVGDGLVTLDEFADHAGLAYAARTRAELDAVTRDLRLPVVAASATPAAAPAPRAQPAPAAAEPPTKRRWIVAIMGGEERKGRWRVPRRQGAFALMAGVELDLREALLEDDVVEITAWAIMGGVSIVVPEGIAVESEGFMLMGGRTNRVKGTPLPGSPIVRVKGYGLWGGVDVRSRKPGRDAGEDETAGVAGRYLPPPLPAPPTPPTPAALPPLPHHRRRSRHDWADESRRRSAAPEAPAPAPPAPAPVAAGVVTIVCTDIVGSTRLADTLGDQRWRDLVGAHNTIVRAQLARYDGIEVKTSGDGFLVTFASARKAVAFALDVHEAVRRLDLELRIGLHAGEVERDGTDIVGRNVSLACRLCDVAAPGEVLASSMVADLADSSSDLAFGVDRELHLAGIDRTIHARSGVTPAMTRTAAVVLAAGAGTRFAGPGSKLLATLRERPLVAWAVEHAVDAALDEVIVVVGGIDVARALPAGVTVVRNDRWAGGIATSLAAGVGTARAGGHGAVVVGLGDQPFVDTAAWQALAACEATPIAVATYDGVRGNPVRLAAAVWGSLPVVGDEGARRLLQERPDLVTEVPCPGSAVDIDTVEDLAAWS